MFTRAQLLEMLANGESSGVEFKEDTVELHKLAKELVALANLQGGVVLLGAADDGTVRGITRPRLEEWVMTTCRDKIKPEIIPYFQIIRHVEPGKDLAIVRVERGFTVHHLWHHNHRTYYTRVGSQSREASQEELARLMLKRHHFRVDLAPVSGTSFNDLDLRRVREYFTRIRGQAIPDDGDDAGWRTLLYNTEILADDAPDAACNLAGLLLFGHRPERFLPQSGVDAFAFPGRDKDYAATGRQRLRGPLVGLHAETGRGLELLEGGLVERAADFVARLGGTTARIVDGARREDKSAWVLIRHAEFSPVTQPLARAFCAADSGRFRSAA